MTDDASESTEVSAHGNPMPAERTASEQVAEMAAIAWQTGSGVDSELAKHVTPAHIDKALDHADNAHKRLGEDRVHSRKFKLAALGMGFSTLLGLVGMFLFTNNAALLVDHMDAVFALAAGGFGGFGIGRHNT